MHLRVKLLGRRRWSLHHKAQKLADRSGFDFKHAPPTYEDVIAGHILDVSDSPTELRRNFQQTWQESERVFKNLGYATSDASATEMKTTSQEESAFMSGK